MPGTWTCAAISIVLIYIDDQDREIMRDGLTGLNNRKTLDAVFTEYVRQITPESKLYLFMLDLDRFKRINDTYGHSEGDRALVAAAKILTGSMGSLRGIIVRFGGDEFLIMGFFPGDEAAEQFKGKVLEAFRTYDEARHVPYHLGVSIGSACYVEKQTLEEFIESADGALYAVKRGRPGRSA